MRSILLALIINAVFLPSFGFAQTDQDAYQSVTKRQVCVSAAIFNHPGGTQIAQVAAGDVISINDVSFSPDGALYFQFGEEEAPQFIASVNVAHFCSFTQRAVSERVAFLAPPNTCHIIAASRRTLEEVNAFTAGRTSNAAVMNVFRAQNGWYAISLGQVSLAAAELVLSQGQDIPDDAYCSDGANYTDVMDRRDGLFLELDPPAPADSAARRAEAIKLGVNRNDQDNAERLRRSCLLGYGPSCTMFADLPAALDYNADQVAQDQTRFNLLGCMLGEPAACNNALSGQGLQNRALFAALPDRIGAASAPPVLNPELAKVGCDSGLAPSCWALAEPAVQYHTDSILDYLTSVQATFSACVTAQGWYCQMFEGQMSRRYSVMEKSWPPAALFGVAQVLSPVCQISENADSTGCRVSYSRYNTLLQTGDGTRNQLSTAALAIDSGCNANSITACAFKSALRSYFDLDERRLAAATVLAACEAGDNRPDTCDGLIKTLGTDLPEAASPIRREYEARADLCRTTQGTDGSNPCMDALYYYGNNISTDDISEPLALLHDTCGNGDKITGCAPLSRYHDGEELLFTDAGIRKSWPEQPELALKALKTGCVATLEAVGNCGSLGLKSEQQGDFTAATQAYTLGCETGMTAANDQYFGQDRVCYWAARNARDNVQDYANARRWFSYNCYTNDDPFACKFLGLMFAQSEGGEADPLAAMNVYHRACYLTDDITYGDGQACYLFAHALVAARAGVTYSGMDEAYTASSAGTVPNEVTIENLSAASQAFFRGCVDNRVGSCTAHDALLSDWVSGAYPTEVYECRLMDAAGQMGPVKTCQHLPHYMSVPDEVPFEGWVSIFVWPDGDRTVTFDNNGAPNLNGAAADYIFPEGGWECIKSRSTGRSFCYGMS